MTAVLSVRGLGKDYGPRTAVQAIDLDVARGECLGLLGPNGAGKTTTISMASGVLTPSRGTIRINGADLATAPFVARAALGLVPQELALYEELTAQQNLAYFGALYGLRRGALAARIAWALEAVGLGDRAGEQVRHYSGGMKRRLNLAAGLVHRPALLILDEPTVGFDPQSRNHIFESVRALRDAGMAIVYTTHYMEEVEALCDRVAIIDGGAIVATGTVAELVDRHAGKELVLELGGEAAQLEAAHAAAATHGTAERSATTLRILPRHGLGPVVTAIEATGVTIRRISSHEADLETAFLALTGRALRDAS